MRNIHIYFDDDPSNHSDVCAYLKGNYSSIDRFIIYILIENSHRYAFWKSLFDHSPYKSKVFFLIPSMISNDEYLKVILYSDQLNKKRSLCDKLFCKHNQNNIIIVTNKHNQSTIPITNLIEKLPNYIKHYHLHNVMLKSNPTQDMTYNPI